MPCLMSNDQPLRVQITKNGVIHAGSIQDYGGFTRSTYAGPGMRRESKFVPKQKRVTIACKWQIPETGYGDKVVSNKKNITCKSCQKKIGMMDDEAVFPDRFVIRKISTGEFLKNTSSRCSAWSDHLSDAWFWKRKGDAERRCNTGSWWIGNKRVKWGAARENDGVKPEWRRIRNPDYEIKKVSITLED